jgi:hypothetical protein
VIYQLDDGTYRFWREIRGIGRTEVYRSLADLKPLGHVVVPATDAEIAAWMEAHPERRVVRVLDELEVAA